MKTQTNKQNYKNALTHIRAPSESEMKGMAFYSELILHLQLFYFLAAESFIIRRINNKTRDKAEYSLIHFVSHKQNRILSDDYWQ